LQALLFLIVLFFKDIAITNLIVFSLIFTFFKLEILLSLVFFFSTFMSNILTILVSLMVYFLSHSFSLILDMASRTKDIIIIWFVKWLQLLFPPMEALNIKDVIWSYNNFSSMYFISNTMYAIFYLLIILYLSVKIFNRKKFEN
jgi:hypothetical protein